MGESFVQVRRRPDEDGRNAEIVSDRVLELWSRVRQDEVAAAHIDSLAQKYLGVDKNPYAKLGDVRVMFEITVLSVQGMS